MESMKTTIIVAMSNNGIIGDGSNLPWKSKRDMKHFVSETIGKFLLVGRKTYESIPKELKGRETLVLSARDDFKPAWGRKVSSIEEVADIVGNNELMVAGGAEVYRQMLPIADKLIITTVSPAKLNQDGKTFSSKDQDIKGDVYFPDFNRNEWFNDGFEFFPPTEDEDLVLSIRNFIRASHVFITSDHHLGETRMEIMQRPFSSPEEMAHEFIDRHNKVVSPGDLVYFVGDVINQNADPAVWLPLLEKFNGRKVLFRGNHERKISDEVLSKYFEKIYPEGEGHELEVSGVQCWVNHYPTLGKINKFNLVGHVHGAWKVQLNMLNVGVDANHFYPHQISKVLFYKTAIEKFFDEDVWVAYSEQNMGWKGRRGKPGSYINP